MLLQQRILEESSSSLYNSLLLLKACILEHFGDVGNVAGYWGSMLLEGEALSIVSLAHLEIGIIEHKYGRVDSSR